MCLKIRVLRRICGSAREDVTGFWTKLHNVQLHSLYPFNRYFLFCGLFNDAVSNAVCQRVIGWLMNIEMAEGWRGVGRGVLTCAWRE